MEGMRREKSRHGLIFANTELWTHPKSFTVNKCKVTRTLQFTTLKYTPSIMLRKYLSVYSAALWSWVLTGLVPVPTLISRGHGAMFIRQTITLGTTTHGQFVGDDGNEINFSVYQQQPEASSSSQEITA